MSLFGVGLDIEVKKINTQFKMQIQKKGGIGIRTLGSLFKRMDTNGNRKLNQEEFTQALATYGLFPKIVEVQALMKYYDIDGDGNITYEEFLRGLREPLNERRLKMVQKAFAQMDKDGSGKITFQDIYNVYDVSRNKDFIDGTKSRDQILNDFLSGFEGAKGNRDGIVTYEEWVDYYTDLSMSITDDLYFVKMMESVWCTGEDEDAGVFKEQIEFLTSTLRLKLRTFANQNSEEYVLRGLFKDFDTNKSGSLTIDELTAMLAKLQISVDRKYVSALFKKFDKNNNGIIEFEEFCEYIIQDPYK